MIKNKGFSKAGILVLTFFLFVSVITGGTYSWFYNTNKVNTFQGTVVYSASLTLFEKMDDGTSIENPPPIPGSEYYLFKVSKQSKGIDDEQIGGKYVTDKDGIVFIDNLKEGTYYFLETNPSYGFDYDKDEDGNQIKRYYFTVNDQEVDENNHVSVVGYNRQLVADLIVCKIVVNEDGSELTEEQKNQNFIFDVDFSSKDNYQYSIDGGPPQPILDNIIILKHNQTATIKDIRVGTLYAVRERVVENYDIVSNNHQGHIQLSENKVEYKNIYFEDEQPEGNTTLKVIKKVEGLGADKEKEFHFVLIVDGVEQKFTLKNGEIKEFIIPEHKLYEVIEEDDKGEYIQSTIINGYATSKGEVIEIIKTNTYIGLGKTDVTVNKIWDVPSGKIVPESIHVMVKDGEYIVAQKEITVSDNWQYTFKDLQKYTTDGKEIVYTVIEDAIDGYQTIINGYTIINKYREPLVVESPTITKEIEVKDIKPDKPIDFIFYMIPIDNAPIPEFSSITITGDGQNSFGKISFNEVGTYSYKINEDQDLKEGYIYDSSEYIITYTVTRKDGVLSATQSLKKNNEVVSHIKFINAYDKTTPPPVDEKTSLSVVKSWSHGTNKRIPTEVKVQLYKNGIAYGNPILLNKNNSWSKVFVGLNQSDIWTIDEVSNIEGYTKTVVKKADGIYEIINTHESAPEDPELGVMTINGTKTWKHNGNKDIPSSITLYIKSQYGIAKEFNVTGKTDWTWSEVLPKYDKKGKIINYYMEEKPVKNYKTRIDGFNVINTYSVLGTETGDYTRISLWLALFIGSAITLKVIISARRRKKDKD